MRKLRDIFSFSRKELNGILVLLCLLSLVLLANLVASHWIPEPRADFSAFEEEIAAISPHPAEWTDTLAEAPEDRQDEEAGELFYFDPNTTGMDDLLRLGMNRRAAGNLLKYVEKGGRIRRKKDLLKIYGLSRAEYGRLEPFIDLPPADLSSADSPDSAARKTTTPEYRDTAAGEQTAPDRVPLSRREIPVMELNTADSAMLIRLPGIGEVLSARIVRYRKRLGGFYARKQLLEVYGLDTSWYHRFEKYLTIDTLAIRKIRINRAGAGELLRLPYWSRNQVNVLLNYRDQHGPFDSAAALEDIRVLDNGVIQKVIPYLSFE